MSYASAGPERFRLSASDQASPVAAESSGLNLLPTPSEGAANVVKPWSPESPMFAFGCLAALTFGLMAFSTSGTVRVGKTKLTAGVGVGSTS
jgi:hypothetical protein